ncbi:hypothetical protein Pcinc_008848 [Petrolisthes cinctipes]|uniref:tRNA pseudouridine synthase n=1 Tax=Petrolisthes cinctipes TaxID=88211 RepID=A0AAE1G5X8_PETCI|nr:hypothetical protein Pcinc_008848 [Petrolisthes cinctipes]
MVDSLDFLPLEDISAGMNFLKNNTPGHGAFRHLLRHSRRHVVLKFAYLGWDYQGYATQEDTSQTIEAKLFTALLKTRLIQSRQTSNYHRTDKGVSAFEQVISITVRSKCHSGVGVEAPQCGVEAPQCGVEAPQQCPHPNTPPQPSQTDNDNNNDDDDTQELNYIQMLNRVLHQRSACWLGVPYRRDTRQGLTVLDAPINISSLKPFELGGDA